MSRNFATRSTSESSVERPTKDLEEALRLLKLENEKLRRVIKERDDEIAKFRSSEAEHVRKSVALREDIKGLNYQVQKVLDDYT